MRKLKLESLQVESFETTRSAPRMRGTVDGAEAPLTVGCPGTGPSDCAICQPLTYEVGCVPETYDANCETRYFDCTYGCVTHLVQCSAGTGCIEVCWANPDDSINCPIG